MIVLPRTLLARTFLLTAGLVTLTTAALLFVFRLSEAEPRAREAAQLGASVVNLVRAALIASSPDKRPDFFLDLGHREGIRLLPAESSDQLSALPDERFFRLLQQEIQTRLGGNTRLALAVNGVPGYWISFRLDDQDDDEYWVMLPGERTEFGLAWHWLAWGALALGLALLVAWFIASRLSRPLQALARAAAIVGRGQTPPPLPESGAIELCQLATAFNLMARDLERHEQDRAEVLAGISHDLRTPLTRLRLEAELSVADPDSRDAVVADIEQMEAVIAQFLDYARGEATEGMAPTDVSLMLQDIADRHRKKNRQVIACLSPLPEAQLHGMALARAVDNLVENALKYAGGEIELDGRLEGTEIVIEVSDRGPGIPAADVERVKRPFIRLDAARGNATGTGLGLAIVDRVARLHGGTFNLMARDGGGLIAQLRLPVKQ